MSVNTQYEILVKFLKIQVEKNQYFIPVEKIEEILETLEELKNE